MSVVELHPEELLDKWARGELSVSEQARLDAHFEGCSTCRLELELRRDFKLEAADIGPARVPERLLVRSLTAPLRGPSRRHSPMGVWGLAAAGLVAATAAVASGLTWARSWQDHAGEATRSASVERSKPARPKRVSALSGSANSGPAADESPADSEPEVAASALPMDAAGTSRSTARAGTVSASHRESPASLFAAANLARRQGELGRATELYRSLRTQFPASEEAQLSLVTFAKLELDRGNASAALGSFDQYVTRRGPLEAEALVGRATALERLGRRGEAAVAWHTVADRYPGSMYARQATERLSALSVP